MERLSKEEALRLHKEMWEWIHQVECLGDEARRHDPLISHRASLKSKFLEDNGYNEDEVLNQCFLCEYASQQLDLRESSQIYGQHCKYCPVYWKSNMDKFMCESEDEYEGEYDWKNSDAHEIANLQERDIEDEQD